MRIVFSLLFLLCLFETFSQPNFQKGYAIESPDAIIQTSGNGYMMSGATDLYGAGQEDVFLIKLGPFGEVEWAKTYGAAGNERGLSVYQTNDGGYIVAGYSTSASGFLYLIKTNAQGDTLWTRSYDATMRAQQIIELSNGDFMVSGDYELSAARISSNGNLIWAKKYGDTNDWGGGLIELPGGDFILSGTTQNYGAGSIDFALLKIDGAGDTIWSKTYGESFGELCTNLFLTSYGSIIMCGTTQNDPAGQSGYCVMQVDTMGNLQWSKVYGRDREDNSYGIAETNDSTILIHGQMNNSIDSRDWDYGLLALNQNGDTIWTRSYVSNVRDFGNDVLFTDDYGIMMSGFSTGFPFFGCYLVKTNNQGFSYCNNYNPPIVVNTLNAIEGNAPYPITNVGAEYSTNTIVNSFTLNDTTICEGVGLKETIQLNGVSIYPNPTTGVFTVQGATGIIAVYDLFCRLIIESDQPTIDLSQQPKGIYVVRVATGQGIATKKVVVY